MHRFYAGLGPETLWVAYDDQPAQAGQATQGVGYTGRRWRRCPDAGLRGGARRQRSCEPQLLRHLTLRLTWTVAVPGRHPAGVPAAGRARPPQPAAVLPAGRGDAPAPAERGALGHHLHLPAADADPGAWRVPSGLQVPSRGAAPRDSCPDIRKCSATHLVTFLATSCCTSTCCSLGRALATNRFGCRVAKCSVLQTHHMVEASFQNA